MALKKKHGLLWKIVLQNIFFSSMYTVKCKVSLYFYKITDKAKPMKCILEFIAVPVPIHAHKIAEEQ